jgi:transposase
MYTGEFILKIDAEDRIEQYDKIFNGESIIDFLTRTRDVYQKNGTIHLILDGAGHHRSGLLTEAA